MTRVMAGYPSVRSTLPRSEWPTALVASNGLVTLGSLPFITVGDATLAVREGCGAKLAYRKVN